MRYEPQGKETKARTLGEIWTEHKDRLAEAALPPELPIGIGTLDGPLHGLRRGNLLTIGARTGTGKTSLALFIAKHLAGLDKKVVIFSTEMQGHEILRRLLAEKVGEELAQQIPLLICDQFEPSIGAVREVVENHKPDVFIFDHIQHAGGSDATTRYHHLSMFARGLHDLAREYSCAGLICSQLTRAAEFRTPVLADLKECGTIEDESSAVVLLSVLNAGMDQDILAANLAKNRFGPRLEVQVTFDKKKGVFS